MSASSSPATSASQQYFSWLPSSFDDEHRKLLIHQLIVSSLLSDIVYEKSSASVERQIFENRFLRTSIGRYQSTTSIQSEEYHLEMLFCEYVNSAEHAKSAQSATEKRVFDTAALASSTDTSPTSCILATMKGSKEIKDWMSNTTWALEECVELSPARVHSGFYSTLLANVPYRQLARAALKKPSKRLVISGHSRGAAIALLMSLLILSDPEFRDEIDLWCFTFGAPLVGNALLQSLVDRFTARDGYCRFHCFINEGDPVPLVLSAVTNSGYAPCGQMLLIREVKTNEKDKDSAITVDIDQIDVKKFYDMVGKMFKMSQQQHQLTAAEELAVNEPLPPPIASEAGIEHYDKPNKQSVVQQNLWDVVQSTFDTIRNVASSTFANHLMKVYCTILTTYLYQSNILDESYLLRPDVVISKMPARIVAEPEIDSIAICFDEHGKGLKVRVTGANVDGFTLCTMKIRAYDTRWGQKVDRTVLSIHDQYLGCAPANSQSSSSSTDVLQVSEYLFPPLESHMMLQSELVLLTFQNLFFSKTTEGILPVANVGLVLPSDLRSLGSLVVQDIVRRKGSEGHSVVIKGDLADQILPKGQVDLVKMLQLRGWSHQEGQEEFLPDKLSAFQSKYYPQLMLLLIPIDELSDMTAIDFKKNVLDTVLGKASQGVWLLFTGSHSDRVLSFVQALTKLYRSDNLLFKRIGFLMIEEKDGVVVASDVAAKEAEPEAANAQQGATLGQVIAAFFANLKRFTHPSFAPDISLEEIDQKVRPFLWTNKGKIVAAISLMVAIGAWRIFIHK